MTRPTLITFLGGLGHTPAERLVADARRAAARDTIEAALSTGAYHNVIFPTDDFENIPDLPDLQIDLDAAPFHFGRRLADLIALTRIERVVYLGGGSVPLFGPDDFRDLAAQITDDTAITNNAFSSDLVAFPIREGVLEAIAPLERDNALARALE
jgi:hypothetical protein